MTDSTIMVRCGNCKALNRVPDSKLYSHPHCGQCKDPLTVPREPLHVTGATYDRQVQGWPEILLAEFWARWCGYCRAIEPHLMDLAAKNAGRLKIVRIDVDAEPALARRFTIKATPTFILYRNGSQISRMDGAPSQQNGLETWIDQSMLQSIRGS